MKLPRRQFLHLAAGAAALPIAPHVARAQAYPTRPVRLIVPVPAGGPIDLAARLIGQWLAERFGQSFVVENRPSAGGNLGTEAVVKAPPDGYTLLLTFAGSAINATLFDNLPYNFIRDIVPVASVNHIPLVLEANPSFSPRNIPELIAYSLQNVAQTVYNAVEPLAIDKKLAFKAEVQSDLPAGRGDERRQTQVLLNLVGNAIKFTDAGEVVIQAGAKNGDFHLSVRDTGPGISAVDQTKLFQEFQQAENPTTRKKEGTGLGLAISKRIIEMHGGRIWIESQLGQGSTFFITLPAQVQEQAKSSN